MSIYVKRIVANFGMSALMQQIGVAEQAYIPLFHPHHPAFARNDDGHPAVYPDRISRYALAAADKQRTVGHAVDGIQRIVEYYHILFWTPFPHDAVVGIKIPSSSAESITPAVHQHTVTLFQRRLQSVVRHRADGKRQSAECKHHQECGNQRCNKLEKTSH